MNPLAPRIRDLLRDRAPGDVVEARGWLRTARHSKSLSFLELYDGSCFAGLQAVCNSELDGYDEVIRPLTTGSSVVVRGRLVESPGKGQSVELHADTVECIGAAGPDYPLQKKRHSFEFLRTIAHLRPRTNTMGAVFRVRNEAARAIHEFFQSRSFLYLHTPIITASDCEGAGEMFRVTTLPPERAGEFDADFFGRESHLTVSGQLEGEIGALALGNVYTFGPTFRAENSNTSRHLAEFWMVEPEMAFCDLEGDADVAALFLKEICAKLLERCDEDLRFFADRIDAGVIERLEHVVAEPFERLSYGEAIERLGKSGESFEFPVEWGADLQSEHERWLTETHIGRPVIVTDWPKAIKAFYMYENDDGRTVRAMDVLAPRIGEIIGGSQREDRLDVLERRLADCDLPAEDYWWYLDLRRYGSVPHAGFGLGFERFIQFATGVQNIREAIPFPRVPGSADF